MKKKRILVIASHPDDEILGCGGTIAKLVKEGYEAYTLILGEGITSRDKSRNRNKREKEIQELKKQARRANKIIGVHKVFTRDFPDNRFDTAPLLDIVKEIEVVKRKIKPDIVYTHYWGDLNVDHRITCDAVLTACRPITKETVKEIYCFEIPSSTEWNYPNVFNPNKFVDITKTFKVKIRALRCYDAELKEFTHPRSEEALDSTAKHRGNAVGLCYAEAFSVIRQVK